MKRRRMFAWLMLSVLLVVVSNWVSDLVLWAQEGALGPEEQLEKQREKARSLAPTPAPKPAPTPASTPPATPPPGGAPQVTYAPGLPPGQAAAQAWGNMNWFALYLVLAAPTTYFVFRGAAH